MCAVLGEQRCEGPVLPHVVSLLEDAELRFIDAELSARRFEGLAVYYFGRREPRTVGELPTRVGPTLRLARPAGALGPRLGGRASGHGSLHSP